MTLTPEHAALDHRAIRVRSVELRAQSESLRHRVQAARTVMELLGSGQWGAVLKTSHGLLAAPVEVRVSELFLILTEEHDLGILQACRVLVIALQVAGYEPDAEVVSGADAIDFVTAFAGRPRSAKRQSMD